MKKHIALLLGTLLAVSSYATQYRLPDSGRVIGEFQSVVAKRGDTLNRLAVRHGVGYNEMSRANPKWRGRKIPSGTMLTLPTKHQLPATTRHGIVINLADMRLFYYPPSGGKVITFPVAIGKRGWSTPKGKTSIISKRKNPTWTPPASIRREAAKKGRKLRRVYPAGPNNPLGTRALRLGISGYLIHGTNKPWSIGKRVSHGCIRMRRADVEKLYSMVPVNTPVTIVSERSRLTYPKSPSSSRAYVQQQRQSKSVTKKTKSVARQRKNSSTRQSKNVAKQSYHETRRNTQKQSRSYINNGNLDYQRLQRDIDNGATKPIDLSGI